MKKILLLGGSQQQIVAIETAKRLGYFTVLCDYLPDNPGQYVADQFYLMSTTNKEGVLQIAQNEKIDGIVAYASDPAAPTAAYVAEKMGLPGNPYDSVDLLCNKEKFRSFLAANGFHTPLAKAYDSIDAAVRDLKEQYFSFPVIVKPIDSSGSKGVGEVTDVSQAEEKIRIALNNSRAGRFIIEEYVVKYGYQIAGDGLSVDGKLVFRCFANDHFDPESPNPFVPVAASFPYNMPAEVQDKIHSEIQRLLTLLGMQTCTYNFDMRIDKDYNVYLMEVAPRNGGNFIPQVIRYATGVDLIELIIRASMGEKIESPGLIPTQGFWAYYSVHSYSSGILEEVRFSSQGAKKVIENHVSVKPGDRIEGFERANSTLGCLIMKFDSMDEMLYMLDHSSEWIEVKVK